MAANQIMSRAALERRGSADLHAPGWLARWPVVGILMFLAGSLVFGAFAYNLTTRGPLLHWDVPVTTELHSEAVKTPWPIIEFLIFGFFVGKELVQVLTIILLLYFVHKRLWRELSMLLIGVGGGAILWYVLMGFFHRTRPPVQMGIVVSDFSFPSGHVMTAVLFYGLLAYLFVPKMPSLFWKWVVAIGAILTMLFIGFSRLFLGGHYLSDLIAGYALGVAWAGLVYTLIERLFWKRKTVISK